MQPTMSGFACDQAEGLRRLLGQDQLRVIAVISGKARIGQTTAILNLAHTLTRQGKSVMVLDCGSGHDSCVTRLGLLPRCELMQVLQGKASLDQALLQHRSGLQVLPAQEGLRKLGHINTNTQEALRQALLHLPQQPDLVLLDLDAQRNTDHLAACAAADSILVMISPDAQAITQSYALIKQISVELGRREIHIVTSKTRDAAHARTLSDNILAASARYLNTHVQVLGTIPLDESVKRANKANRTIIEAFPDAPASQAFQILGQMIAAWPMMRENSGHLDGFLQRLIMSSRSMEAAIRV